MSRAYGHFFSKVAGISHQNGDGSQRQAIASACRMGEKLTLDSEPDNTVDANAIRVLRDNGEQLGYLGASVAEDVTVKAAKGYRYAVFVANVTGGNDKSLGCNLVIVW